MNGYLVADQAFFGQLKDLASLAGWPAVRLSPLAACQFIIWAKPFTDNGLGARRRCTAAAQFSSRIAIAV
jgi:hypothetical protein